MAFRIVETDNYGGDYPNEVFLNVPPFHSEAAALIVAHAINEAHCRDNGPRFWKVVPDGYKLSPGFEP